MNELKKLWKATDLSAGAKLLFSLLWLQAGRTPGRLIARPADLAADLGASARSARRWLADLEAADVLAVTDRPARGAWRITIYQPRPPVKPPKPPTPGGWRQLTFDDFLDDLAEPDAPPLETIPPKAAKPAELVTALEQFAPVAAAVLRNARAEIVAGRLVMFAENALTARHWRKNYGADFEAAARSAGLESVEIIDPTEALEPDTMPEPASPALYPTIRETGHDAAMPKPGAAILETKPAMPEAGSFGAAVSAAVAVIERPAPAVDLRQLADGWARRLGVPVGPKPGEIGRYVFECLAGGCRDTGLTPADVSETIADILADPTIKNRGAVFRYRAERLAILHGFRLGRAVCSEY